MPLSDFDKSVVLVTGHTGFKGSWLGAWLTQLGARVVGIALDPSTEPSHFDAIRLGDRVDDRRVDIRDRNTVRAVVGEVQPDYMFHLAAQPIVRQSYADPLTTHETNIMGTLHVLEALRSLKKECTAVLVTSDKAYQNQEWVWGYRETDPLGGFDPYSASKGAAELIIRSHVKSYFDQRSSPVRIAVGRAGNVIGGGDWAPDRIVPDCARAWAANEVVRLRNPHGTRPWQHVLEALSGYLMLAIALRADASLHGEPFNFGPPAEQNHSVLELVQFMSTHWKDVRWEDASQNTKQPQESALLKLNCDKALHRLRWRAVLDFDTTCRLTAEWYRNFYARSEDAWTMAERQIVEYTAHARSQGLGWAR